MNNIIYKKWYETFKRFLKILIKKGNEIFKRFLKLPIKKRYETFKRFLKILIKKGNEIFKRFLKILFIISLLIAFSTIFGLVFSSLYHYYVLDKIFTGEFMFLFIVVAISFIPLMIIYILDYIIYDSEIFKRFLKLPIKKRYETFKRFLKILIKKGNEIFKRFLKILFIISLLIAFGAISGLIFEGLYHYYVLDKIFTGEFMFLFIVVAISFIPLMIIYILDYIIYDSEIFKRFLKLPIKKRYETFKRFLKILIKKGNEIFKRFLKILFIISLLIAFGAISGLIFEGLYHYYVLDKIFTGEFMFLFIVVIISFIPLMIVCILNYIIYGSLFNFRTNKV